MDKVIMPSKSELDIAIQHAHAMRDADKDTYHMAKTLLSHDVRIQKLERVLEASMHYLHSGLGGKEHHVLEVAIREAKGAAYRPGEPLSLDDELII